MIACRPNARHLVLVFCASGVCWLTQGCRSSKEEIPVPVSGTVSVAGKPLMLGWVTFHPDEAKGNRSPRLPFAEIKKDGTYELSTNGKPGATCGIYKVVVTATKDPIPAKPFTDDGKPWKPKWLHHDKYATPETTDLQIEVIERPEPGRYDLKLVK